MEIALFMHISQPFCGLVNKFADFALRHRFSFLFVLSGIEFKKIEFAVLEDKE
jgi:hypothetical protein